MTDDEILDAIDRRFAGVESQLPLRRVAAVGHWPVRGATFAGGALRGAALPLVGVLVVAILVAAGLALRPTERLAATGAAASASALTSASVVLTSPSSAPVASASEEPFLILRGSSGGDTLLMEHFRWGPTMCGFDGSIVALDGAAVDRAVDHAGSEEGWVVVPFPFLLRVPSEARVWVDATPESAARGYGSTVLAIGGRGDTWIVLDGKGREMVPFPTPKGRTFWILTGGIANGGCGQN